MNALINYLILPNEVSPTEKAHVDQVNQVAIIALYLHIPLFMGVAYVCDTGPLFALVLTVFTLIGPTICFFTVKNHRHLSCIIGFTTMCLGGLLAHFGQGPMQIEMHFYFFVMLALLATYANPAVNLTAAATAAVHHFGVWLLLPSSVFNYEASIWVVVVHAIYVVVETIAAIFIARSFFDNVIGLEKVVEARTKEVKEKARDMKLVLDHVKQGLVTVNITGQITGERSSITDVWLNTPPESSLFADWLRVHDPKAADWFELGIIEIEEDILPMDVLISQLPSQMTVPSEDGKEENMRYIQINYQVIYKDDICDKILVVMTDISFEVQQAKAEALQQENLRIFELLASNASGFDDFYQEAQRIAHEIQNNSELPLAILKRLIHTLKGNTALFGLERIAKICGQLEDSMEESDERPTPKQMTLFAEAWTELEDKVQHLTEGDRKNQMVIDKADLDNLVSIIQAQSPHETIEHQVKHITLEPCKKRLSILAEQAQKIADRLGRKNISIAQEIGDDIRLESSDWSAFWSSMVHVLRNAIDHGLEPEAERQSVGKDHTGIISIRTAIEQDSFILEVEDDGRGVDLHRLKEKAEQKGLNVDTEAQLLKALFADGLSTKETISETSGRGVGMAAVLEEAEALGGEIQVHTEPGQGTRFTFMFPIERASVAQTISG